MTTARYIYIQVTATSSATTQSQLVKVALYNGTTTIGITKVMEKDLTAKLLNGTLATTVPSREKSPADADILIIIGKNYVK